MPTSSTPLVLVSGSGRSGTSSLAGTLKRLGLHVPQPEVEASETNPRGFYEPQWVIDFHKRHLKELALFNIDSRPAAVDIVARHVGTGLPTGELHEWLSGQLAEYDQAGDQIVVKDPHAFWFAQVWEVVSAELGADLRWLTALRHPAEVVGSQDITWGEGRRSDAERRVKETSNTAAWLNVALVTEQGSRGAPRAFLRYDDLLTDWRTALGRVSDQLGLGLPLEEERGVDDFLDPGMRRSQLTWDDIVLPDWLRGLAEDVWQQLGALVEDPLDPAVPAALDTARERYDAAYAEAVAVSLDEARHRERRGTAGGATKIRGRLRAERARRRRAEERVRQLESGRGAGPGLARRVLARVRRR